MDGCSSDCEIESNWECQSEPSICNGICGDSSLKGGNECDDGNSKSGDGCSSSCKIEFGWSCSKTEPSICTKKSGLSSGEIAAIVISIVFCCFLMIAIIIFGLIWYRKSKKAKIFDFEMNHKIPILHGIKVGNVIGSGQFGQVYRGDWNSTQVALKSVLNDNIEEFLQEMNLIIEIRHPNVLTLFGLYEYQNQPMIVNLWNLEIYLEFYKLKLNLQIKILLIFVNNHVLEWLIFILKIFYIEI